jgi:hypothetical protein
MIYQLSQDSLSALAGLHALLLLAMLSLLVVVIRRRQLNVPPPLDCSG